MPGIILGNADSAKSKTVDIPYFHVAYILLGSATYFFEPGMQ